MSTQPHLPLFRPAALCALLVASLPTAAHADPSADAYTRTRYPIVLVPGAIVFDMPLDAWSYWFGIVEALQQGGATVFVSRIPVGVEEVRGAVLEEQVDRALAQTGTERVNLIGYSQGGQTVRYLAATAPNKVASVTTVSSPHHGSPVAEALVNDAPTPGAHRFKQYFLSVLYGLSTQVSVLPHEQNDFLSALASLTPSGAARFNADFPRGVADAPCRAAETRRDHQRYYSWGGVGHLTNPLDLSDPAFLSTMALFKGPNDGMVGQCSSHFGHVVRDDYRQNHFDGINQMFGLSAWRGVNPKSIYRAHANRLKQAGL